MLKIKAYHVHPVNVVCITLLLVITFFLLSGYKTSSPEGRELVEDRMYQPEQPLVIREKSIQYKTFTRDYRIEITQDGKYAVLFDGNRLIGSLPLNNQCNLTNLLRLDQR